MPEPTVLYTRVLPGGGMVSIECDDSADAECSARLTVERRGDPQRRGGHAPPVVLERSGERQLIIGEMYDVALDNVAIARCLIDWQARRRQPKS